MSEQFPHILKYPPWLGNSEKDLVAKHMIDDGLLYYNDEEDTLCLSPIGWDVADAKLDGPAPTN